MDRGDSNLDNNSSNKTASFHDSRLSNSSRDPTFGCDRKLLPRIRQYLADNKSNKFITEESIVEALLFKYPEYKRKKKNSFTKAVSDALRYAMPANAAHRSKPSKKKRKRMREMKNQKSETQSEMLNELSDSDSFSEYDVDEFESPNIVNKSLQDLYSQPSKQTNKADMTNHLIGEDCRTVDTDPRNLKDGSLSMEMHNEQNERLTVGQPIQSQAVKRGANKKMKQNQISTDKNEKEPSKENQLPLKATSDIKVTYSSTKFKDIGGCEKTLAEVTKLLVHMKHPAIYQRLKLKPPRGFLLHGPPGCGKTLLANAIAGELGLPFIKMAATELISGVSGESEERIREIFFRAIAIAPCILFLDEIDSITPKREVAQREMERRIVAQLLTCMDELNDKDINTQVMVIGATNRPDSLDPALRRAGRFDREISMGIPDQAARARVLKVLCNDLEIASDVNFDELAKMTPGFVGADLMALTTEAGMCAVERAFELLLSQAEKSELAKPFQLSSQDSLEKFKSILSWLRDCMPITEEQLNDLHVEMTDFLTALKFVQPSAKREGFATIPDVSWNDIGALHDIRKELQLSILGPVKYPEKFQTLGLSNASGILLCGPPGCGKTLLAKAVANESGINFISVKGPELLNMYVGESERAVRQCFQRARNSAPCVIFFDELDSLCPRRSYNAESGSSARVVNQLLTEMDGLEARKNVFIIGATNRPDIIDPAILRPGRLDKILYVGLPNSEDRFLILMTITKNGTKPKIAEDVDLKNIASDSRCEGYSGADLAALVREASVCAFDDHMMNEENALEVSAKHFERAFRKTKPSVSPKDQKIYDKMRQLQEISQNITVGSNDESKTENTLST